MHEFGVHQCDLVLGIDFTESNKWQGKVTNKGNPLHFIGNRSVSAGLVTVSVLRSA